MDSGQNKLVKKYIQKKKLIKLKVEKLNFYQESKDKLIKKFIPLSVNKRLFVDKVNARNREISTHIERLDKI